MCELLGLAFNRAVAPTVSFRGFRQLGDENPDGWGLASFPDRSALILKEPMSSEESGLARFVADYQHLKSRIFIGHVRFATSGGNTFANTHPFRLSARGRHWVLAHNGGLEARHMWFHPEQPAYVPIGETDSEAAFCTFVAWMTQNQVGHDAFAAIEAWLRALNRFGSMNLLISDGDHLYAYCDVRRHNSGLHVAPRRSPCAACSLEDRHWQLELDELTHPEQRGYVVATQPLTEEDWQPIPAGGLLVFREGAICYGTQGG
jgi:predicted glutamine amidotransferase